MYYFFVLCTCKLGRFVIYNFADIKDYKKFPSRPLLRFEYVSGNTQLLGLILERALKSKTVTQYFQEKLWIPLGMEYDDSWSIDKK